MSAAQGDNGEIKRRTLNILETLLVIALVALAGLIFWLRDAVIDLKRSNVTQEAAFLELKNGWADLPVRVSRLEVRQEATDKAIEELKDTRGLK